MRRKETNEQTPKEAKVLIAPDAPCNGLVAEKVGRNAPCKCGSGKKAKRCCGTTTLYKNREMK